MKIDPTMELKRSVMIRIRTIYFLRKLMQPFIVKSFAFSLLSIVFLSFVDVPNVILNMVTAMEASGSAFSFFGTAFSQSVLALKFIVVAEILVGLVFVKEALGRLTFAKFQTNIAH